MGRGAQMNALGVASGVVLVLVLLTATSQASHSCTSARCRHRRSLLLSTHTKQDTSAPRSQHARQLKEQLDPLSSGAPIHSKATYLRCHGLLPQGRSCLAFGLYYDVQQRTFVAVSHGDAAWSTTADDYKLEHYNITLLPASAAPAPDKTVALAGLHVFWRFTNGGSSYSIGHALVHELYPMFSTLDNLLVGNVPPAFSLVPLDGSVPGVVSHLNLASHNRQVNWQDLANKAAAAGKQWIRIEAATLGDAGHAGAAQSMHYQRHPGPNMFNNMGWLRFRKWMLRSAGLDPDALPSKAKVVLNDKVMPDGSLELRRRIYNVEELARHLQGQFPDVQVERVAFMKMPWAKQIQVLSQTSVFITTEGSSSFRYVFLPPGASVVLLSHPDNPAGAPEVLGDHLQFHEVDKYFPLTYVSFLKYVVHVNSTEEYQVMEKTADGQPRERKHQLYDAHVVVRPDRITPMVREALWAAQLYSAIHDTYAAAAAIL